MMGVLRYTNQVIGHQDEFPAHVHNIKINIELLPGRFHQLSRSNRFYK